MGGGDQLFRVRAAAVLKTRLIGVWSVERPAPERDRTSPILKIAMPLGIGNSLDHERSPFGWPTLQSCPKDHRLTANLCRTPPAPEILQNFVRSRRGFPAHGGRGKAQHP